MANEVDARSGHIRMVQAHEDLLPTPCALEEISADPYAAEDTLGDIISTVSLVRDRCTTTRISIPHGVGLLEAIDKLAKTKSQTRSASMTSEVLRALLQSLE